MAEKPNNTHSKRAYRIRRGFILLAVFACLTLLAVQPFMAGRFPQSADGELHLYRAIAFDHSFRNDSLWPRYASGMAYGYGAPMFNYYATVAMYPQQAFHMLGASFQDAFLLSMIFYALIGTAGAYLLGKAWAGTIAGIATATAYTYAPYMLFDSIWRANVPEFAALALLPWVLWAFYELAFRGRRRDMLLAVILYTLFIFPHNVTTLYGTALLLVYCAFLWWINPVRRRVLVQLGLALALGLALTAFFWLPALAETETIKIDTITESLPFIDVVSNLLKPADVIAPPQTADPTQMQQPVSIALGWVQITLGFVALVLVFRTDNWKLRGLILLAVVLILGMLYMTVEASAWVWEIVPLMRYSQFPWRWLGPASLLLALITGVGVSLVAHRIVSRVGQIAWVTLTLAAMMLYAMPWIYTFYLPNPQAESIVDFHDFERETGNITTSSYGEYLPRWNQAPLDPDRLQGRFAEGEIISRLEAPPGVTIIEADWRGTEARLRLEVVEDTTLVFDWLYVPSWWATLDGEALNVNPTSPHGFVSVAVPAGEYVLETGLGLTAIQSTATTVSLVALVVFTGIGIFWRRLAPDSLTDPTGHTGGGHTSGVPLQWGTMHHARRNSVLITAAVVGVVMFAGKALLIDNAQTLIKRERFTDGIAAGVQIPVEANFDNRFSLLGMDLPDSIPLGSTAQVNLYWRIDVDGVDEDYSSVIHLRDEAGNIVLETGSFQPGELATSNWLYDYYIQERINLKIPSNTPPGTYTLDVGLYLPETLQRLNVINAAGNPEDVKVTLGSVRITLPDSLPRTTELEFYIPVTDELVLLGTNGGNSLPIEATVGEEIKVYWPWYARTQLTQNYRARLAWLDEDGNVVASTPDIPLIVGSPATEWQPGYEWVGRHRLYIPGSLETGEYAVVVQLIGEDGDVVGETIPLPFWEPGADGLTMPSELMRINTPIRAFSAPEMQFEANMTWENGIALLGYDFAPDEGLQFTLYWQTQEELNTSLRNFLHVIDAEGHIVAVHDGVPVEWSRPTTGWAIGEVITETITLMPGAGEYIFRVGWYDPLTDERVLLPDGGDFWVLGDY